MVFERVVIVGGVVFDRVAPEGVVSVRAVVDSVVVERGVVAAAAAVDRAVTVAEGLDRAEGLDPPAVPPAVPDPAVAVPDAVAAAAGDAAAAVGTEGAAAPSMLQPLTTASTATRIAADRAYRMPPTVSGPAPPRPIPRCP